jgi:hypothetical protein
MTLFAQPVARMEVSSVAAEYLTAKRHGSDPECYLSQDQKGRTRPGLLRRGERGQQYGRSRHPEQHSGHEQEYSNEPRQASHFRNARLLARTLPVLLFAYRYFSLIAFQSTSDSRLVYQVRSERHPVSVTHIDASWAAASGSISPP